MPVTQEWRGTRRTSEREWSKDREETNGDRGEAWKKLHSPRGGSLGIVIRAGSAANEDNGIKAFGRYQTECTKPIVNSITAISADERKRLDELLVNSTPNG